MPSPIRTEDPITVVGAGLVGSLLSIYLARRGHTVTVLERRPDMRKTQLAAGRSINLAISARGLHALARVGLEREALDHAIPMQGRMVHAADGSTNFQRYGKDDSQHINSISRAWLNEMLMTRAEETGKVQLQFETRIDRIADGGRALHVHDEPTGTERVVESAVTFGTDGSGSMVRDTLRTEHGAQVESDKLAHGYKELEIPAGPGGAFQLEKHALHIWPRGQYMLIALPNQDGSFTCTLFLAYEGEPSFATLRTPADVDALFARDFADAKALMPDLTEQFFANPTGHMVTVKATPWHHDATLLLGDAAHAIVPFFGQGMNCGFEDCSALEAILDSAVDWPDAFSRFDAERKPNADAIADMAVENFVEMRDKTGDARFKLEKAIEQRLFAAFPGEFLSRYTLVSFELAPYRYAYRVGEVAQRIVSQLAEGIESADQIDLERAGVLVREQLAPLLAERTPEPE